MNRTATTRHTEGHGHLTVPHLTGHPVPRAGGKHRAPRAPRRLLVAALTAAAVLAPAGAADARPLPETTDTVTCAPGWHLTGGTCLPGDGTITGLTAALTAAAARITR